MRSAGSGGNRLDEGSSSRVDEVRSSLYSLMTSVCEGSALRGRNRQDELSLASSRQPGRSGRQVSLTPRVH